MVTGLTVWEFTGLVNDRDNITVNRMICTVAGVYFFFAMAAYNSGITAASIFIPYLVTIIYLMVAELYLKHPDPVGDWAYTMMSQLYIALPCPTLLVAQRAGLPVWHRGYPLCVDTPALCLRLPLGQRCRRLHLWIPIRQEQTLPPHLTG